jgi:outer membrane protein OmpA-like peptidoglycan-associated protein
MLHTRAIRGGAVLATILLMSACASAPEQVTEFDQAKAAVASAEQDPLAQKSASEDLEKARQELAAAESTLQDNADIEVVRFHSYMATRYAEIVKERTADARIQEQIKDTSGRRAEVLLAARDQELAALKAQQTERGMVLTLGDVLFDTASSQLKPGAQSTIAQVASYLAEHPDRRLLIEGHADARGSESYNHDLSERRANAVADALFRQGIAANRISVVGLGEQYPVASNDTASGQQENRRVEVVFSSNDGTFPVAARR